MAEMFKLFAAEKAQKEALYKEMHDQEEEMKKQFDVTNRAITKAVADFEETVTDYEEIRKRVETFVEEIAERCRTAIDDKEEKWLESDAGQAAEEFTQQWETDNFEGEMEEVPIVELQYEMPEELSDKLNELPDGAD